MDEPVRRIVGGVMDISIVIASKDRPELLQRVYRAVCDQRIPSGIDYEIIVVDDGSTPPYTAEQFPRVRFLRTEGVGPARARNLGVAHASGTVVMFTDDDVIVDSEWLASAWEFLVAHREHAGVTGDTSSPPYDPIREHSVEDHVGGSYLTCNVAYRRQALLSVGGFDRLFPHAAHEDRDLAWRIEEQCGPVGFCSEMKVVHPGRPFTKAKWIRRGTLAVDDWLVIRRYPNRHASAVSVRWQPVVRGARRWWSIGRGVKVWRSPLSLLRWLAVAGGQLLVLTYTCCFRWGHLRDTPVEPVPGLWASKRRLAYVGPNPDPALPGAPGVAGLILRELATRGYAFDIFIVSSAEDADSRALDNLQGIRYIVETSSFQFMKWYSRHRVSKMVSSQVFSAMGRRRLAKKLGAMHHASPYDAVYQFSTFESFGVPRRSGIPVVIHPSTHATGELRWLRLENRQGMSADPWLQRWVVERWLALRAQRQGRDARRAMGVMAISEVFGELVKADYGLAPGAVRVVPNCLDMEQFKSSYTYHGGLAAVGRLSSRKGLEDIRAYVEQTANPLVVNVVGTASLWSNNSVLLSGLSESVVKLWGHLSRPNAVEVMGGSAAVVQLSRYEPFGLTVAESLAVGVPVIVTSAVGAAERIDERCKWTIPAGDIAALTASASEAALRSEEERATIGRLCRSEADRLFSPTVVADEWETAFSYFEERYRSRGESSSVAMPK